MPTSNTITPPRFDDFEEGATTFAQQPSLFESSTLAQTIIASDFWGTVFTVALVLSIFLIVGILYSRIRIYQIRKAENAYYMSQPPSMAARKTFGVGSSILGEGSVQEARWRSVLEHVASESPNDWRQAILEADVMLDDAISSRGYTGDGLGEKMKQVHRSDINSIDDSWEAHKLRNRVAHEGSSYDLTQREAKRGISLYEKVFRELGYISK